MEKLLTFVIAIVLVQQAIAIRDKIAPPPRCSRQYEEYNSCGTACPLTCKNKEPRPCTRQCVAGCYCMEGYIRNDADGSCCAPDACPATCLLNEIYNSCGTSCPLTCDNYENPPLICTLNCKVGCECNKEYVRNEADGSCCKTEDCPGNSLNA